MKEQPLSPDEIQTALAALPGWTCQRDALAKEFSFANFREALAFMVRVGFEAEALDHHPEWTNVYRTVAIRLNTHSAGGKVTARDVELARRMEGIVGGRVWRREGVMGEFGLGLSKKSVILSAAKNPV